MTTFCFLSLSLLLFQQAFQVEEDLVTFGNPYQEMRESQRALVNDWFKRLGETGGDDADPALVYNDLPISVKTTFEAVTHALLTTELTDASGESLGTALDRVAALETVKGRIKGVRGDRQFRLYAILEEGSVDVLNASKQFKRGRNLIYHKGYPLSYRLRGGAPSIQFSVSKDRRYVDIDVDYRSSRFPISLFNGHLSASNSDVRAGKNYDRHTGRWEGLKDWWDNWFGFPLLRRGERESPDREAIRPERLHRGKEEIEEAVEDFLQVWLVDQEPERAIEYVAVRSYPSLQPDRGESCAQGLPMSRSALLADMREINQTLGPRTSLDGVATAARLVDSDLRAVERKPHDHFILYSLPAGRALASECADQNLQPRVSTAFQHSADYFFSVLRLSAGSTKSGTLALLWAREKTQWKIVSWEVETGLGSEKIPDIRRDMTVVVERERGDPVFLQANESFLTAWHEGQIDLVADYFSDRALTCQNLFLDDGEAPIEGETALKERLKEALRAVSLRLREAPTLDRMVQPAPVADPDLHVVEHDREDTYTVVSSPEFLAQSLDCGYRLSGGDPLPDPGCRRYGLYYGTLFQLRVPGGDPAALILMWGREGRQWKIVSYDLATP